MIEVIVQSIDIPRGTDHPWGWEVWWNGHLISESILFMGYRTKSDAKAEAIKAVEKIAADAAKYLDKIQRAKSAPKTK